MGIKTLFFCDVCGEPLTNNQGVLKYRVRLSTGLEGNKLDLCEYHCQKLMDFINGDLVEEYDGPDFGVE